MSCTIKGETSYVVLYNYSDCDYSIIKIFLKIEDAFKYICVNEPDSKYVECKMIDVSTPDDIDKKCHKDCLNICYISSGKYNKFELCKGYYEQVSSYAIIPMVIN